MIRPKKKPQPRKKTPPRKKPQSRKSPQPRAKPPSGRKTKKPSAFFSIKKLVLVFFLAMLVVFSVFAAGYMIFFRTVFAQEIPVDVKSTIVFEEPDPPVHEESVVEPEKPGSEALLEKQLPKVAIIIDDLGYHEQIGNDFLDFPVELSYSFLPFAPHSGDQEKIAFISGKTVLLHLRLEPKDPYWDPGPGALFLSDSPELQREKFVHALAAVPHAMGVNTHMGSRYTEDAETMQQLIQYIGAKGLFFIDSFTTAASTGLQMAREQGVKSSRRHVFLDNVLDEDEICNQLDTLVRIAEGQSFAIGIGHPHSETYRALEECLGRYVGRVDFVAVGEVL